MLPSRSRRATGRRSELKVHVHPKATTEPPDVLDGMDATPTGIDYLALVAAEHRQATRRTIKLRRSRPRGCPMTVDKLRTHYALTRTPFSRGIAPSQIFQARTHKEAVARLRWLIDETTIGVES
jgi:type II secretory pathway predicted ATPase ExeA